jgi:hypothetical protein
MGTSIPRQLGSLNVPQKSRHASRIATNRYRARRLNEITGIVVASAVVTNETRHQDALLQLDPAWPPRHPCPRAWPLHVILAGDHVSPVEGGAGGPWSIRTGRGPFRRGGLPRGCQVSPSRPGLTAWPPAPCARCRRYTAGRREALGPIAPSRPRGPLLDHRPFGQKGEGRWQRQH